MRYALRIPNDRHDTVLYMADTARKQRKTGWMKWQATEDVTRAYTWAKRSTAERFNTERLGSQFTVVEV